MRTFVQLLTPARNFVNTDNNNTTTIATTSTSNNTGNIPIEVYRGRPTEQLDGEYTGVTGAGNDNNNNNIYWPNGWTKILMQRRNGKEIGKSDPYWITPKVKYKLRSMVEVKQFLIALQLYNGNENIAYQNSTKNKKKRYKGNEIKQNNYFQQQEKDKVSSVCNWVQCENGDCQKWRKIPLSLNNVDIDIDVLLSGKKFVCSDINAWTTTATPAAITTGIVSGNRNGNGNSESLSCNTPEDEDDLLDTETVTTTK